MAGALLAAGVVSAVVGASFGFVARAVLRQPVAGEHRLAHRAHAAWWLALGAYLVLQGAMTAAAATTGLSLGVYLASRVVAIPLLCAGVWGITYFLVYLYTGWREANRPLAVFFALVAALFAWATFATPQELLVRQWIIEIDDSAPLFTLIYALVGLPPIVASLAYLALLRKVRGRAQRYRIVLSAGGILLYVGTGLAARLGTNDALIFATLVGCGVAAALASLAAYYPPAFVRARLDAGS